MASAALTTTVLSTALMACREPPFVPVLEPPFTPVLEPQDILESFDWWDNRDWGR